MEMLTLMNQSYNFQWYQNQLLATWLSVLLHINRPVRLTSSLFKRLLLWTGPVEEPVLSQLLPVMPEVPVVVLEVVTRGFGIISVYRDNIKAYRSTHIQFVQHRAVVYWLIVVTRCVGAKSTAGSSSRTITTGSGSLVHSHIATTIEIRVDARLRSSSVFVIPMQKHNSTYVKLVCNV